MEYREHLNTLIFEELTISGEVQRETNNVWKEILNILPNINTNVLDGYDSVYYGNYNFFITVYGEKIYMYINIYNFLTKNSFENNKDKINYLNASSMYEGRMKWITLTIPMISGNIIMEPDIKDSLQHELEHIFQGKHGSKNILLGDGEYAKARNLLYSADDDISNLALIIYLGNTSEQDAYINGLYAYLMAQEEPMVKIKWDIVKSSEAYILLMRIKTIIEKLESPCDDLKEKCVNYFKLTPYKMLKLGKKVEFRLTRKIGKVIAKYYKDIRQKFPIKEYFSNKMKKIDYFL